MKQVEERLVQDYKQGVVLFTEMFKTIKKANKNYYIKGKQDIYKQALQMISQSDYKNINMLKLLDRLQKNNKLISKSSFKGCQLRTSKKRIPNIDSQDKEYLQLIKDNAIEVSQLEDLNIQKLKLN